MTERIPVSGCSSTIHIPAAALQRQFLAMTANGGPQDVAARWLGEIDNVRDRYGLPEREPRHPVSVPSKPWPIMTPDPEATAD